jgi:hypothetical protein
MGRPAGIYDGIHEDEYHGGPEVSVSRLKLFAEEGGPAKVKYGERIETRAQALGTLVHTAILEPTQLDKRYAVTDLARAGTKAWDEAVANAMGRELVKRPEMEEALWIRDSVMRHPVIREMVDAGIRTEQSVYWTDPETLLPCRGRLDAYRPEWNLVADIKSTEDASTDGVQRAIRSWSYHWQEAFYREGVERAGGSPIEGFLFCFVEKSKPYLTKVVAIDPIDVKQGGWRTHEELRSWRECVTSGVWPGYSEAIQPVELPEWFRRQS